ncbi:hypothetical protein G7Y89_g12942 [Cudoniella acicularis]|uniref:Uncharacterized protein n=1 Tax=Cudoniella acicularis TaxID=354080 RepID=A0A8H4VWW4_9HELO|nr:hypothetical protein G7Y89_g12942 [Cudoniella acicularis]
MDVKPERVEHIEDAVLGNDEKTVPIDENSDKISISKHNTDLENGVADEVRHELSSEHREYLIARHGTIDLDPLPSMDPADPLNWPTWKKNTNLLLVSFHAMITTFTAKNQPSPPSKSQTRSST